VEVVVMKDDFFFLDLRGPLLVLCFIFRISQIVIGIIHQATKKIIVDFDKNFVF
jgi:hypothetical protein